MQRAFILTLVLIALTFPANLAFSLQEETAPAGDLQQKGQSLNPPSQEAKQVTALEIKGNKSISTNTIASKMKTRIGDPYQENVISDDLKRLYLLGFFSDIKIDTEPYKDGVKVIVQVQERPVIEKITFSGIRRITKKDEKLKGDLKSKEGKYLDYPSLAEDVRTLKKMYEKIGFNQAQVDYKVDINSQTNKAAVNFNVVENQKVRIKDISIEGNTSFADRRILKIIKTRNAWFFNPGVLKDEVLKEDMERIKSFYRREGFMDALVDYEIKPEARRPYLLHLSIRIKEGKKYLVGNITIKGNKDISEKNILSKLKDCTTGKVFSDEALRSDVANIQGAYFDRGYISCQVQEATFLDPATARVDITYNITENEVAYVNKIKVRGNIKTKDVVIRRELRIYPGEKFDGEKLRRSKERLQNLGFFEDVSYDAQDTSVSNKKDLVVDVKETKTGAFSFGGGYSTVDSFVGFVEIEQKNFDWRNWPYFTGAGQDLKLRASFGSLTQDFDLSFTEPWFLDYPVSFGFDAYRRSHKRDTDVGYGYDENVTGGDFRFGKELLEYLRADAMYRYDIIDISSISSDASYDLQVESGKNSISSFTPSLTFDSRDNVFDARKGDYIMGSFELAGGMCGGDKDYWKFFSRASHYFPMPRNAVLELRGRMGVSEPYRNSDRIPIYERFFAGGANTIRGYKERAIGPIDSLSKDPLGGNSLLIGNMEYTYPLLSFLKVATFYDVGNVWEKVRKLGGSGIKSSFGLGVRIKTPIGPIVLDYGIPLNKAPGEDDKSSGRFHFSASHGF
jgi:outer membrane protein insertion porin family